MSENRIKWINWIENLKAQIGVDTLHQTQFYLYKDGIVEIENDEHLTYLSIQGMREIVEKFDDWINDDDWR